MLPPNREYFYLEGMREIREVNVRELLTDVRRGVKRLSEESYCTYYGSTQTSLMFVLAINQALNGAKATSAELTKNDRNFDRLTVRLQGGFTVIFCGIAGGYYGEGSRGGFDILKLLGFKEQTASIIFEKESFKIKNY